MAEKHDLLILPNQGDSSIVLSETRSSLAARGRKEAKSLAARRAEVVYRAIVVIRKGEWYDQTGKPKTPFPPKFFGVVDRSGEFVVDPIYRAIEPFSGGLAAFSPSDVERRIYAASLDTQFSSDLGLWGYLDHKGEIIISPSFERARGFCEDVAAVSANGKWGFIRKNGSWVIRPQYDGALDFENGLACVRVGQKCGFIDKSGEFAIEPRFDLTFAFSEGLACAELGGKVGYIRRNGSFAIEPRFEGFDNGSLRGATSFRSGVARVVLGGKDCLVNQTGDFVLQSEDEQETIGDFNEGIAIVHEPGGNWHRGYYIDLNGQRILRDAGDDSDDLCAETLDAVEGFGEGLGVVAVSFVDFDHGSFALRRHADHRGGRRVHGYVDTQGQVVISPQFAEAKPFKNGLAAVKVDDESGKYGFIDKGGGVCIDAQFARVHDFASGMAAVALQSGREGKWGYVDQDGRIAVSCRFDWAHDFQEIAIWESGPGR
jgi:hypothetical protein